MTLYDEVQIEVGRIDWRIAGAVRGSVSMQFDWMNATLLRMDSYLHSSIIQVSRLLFINFFQILINFLSFI
jgi:hypothetical protein